MGRLIILVMMMLAMPYVFAQHDEYRPLELENNTLQMTMDQTGYYYIYPVNPTNIPLELEVVFTNGWQLVGNIDYLRKITVPANTIDYTYPIMVELEIPEEPFRGNVFFIEYVIYEKSGEEKIRFGPRGMFNVEIVESLPAEPLGWDVVALRMSFLTLLIVIMVITTISVANKYFFTEKRKK